jgi:CRP-like cAMP-binding protein
MKAEEMIDILREHPFLQGMDAKNLEKLAGMAAEVNFGKNDFVFREGDASSFFYLLLSGSVALEVNMPGRTLRVQTLARGEELGWSSILPTKTKHFQARTLEPVRALAFDGSRIRHACEENCQFGYDIVKRVLRVVAGRLEATRIQLVDIYSPGAASAKGA